MIYYSRIKNIQGYLSDNALDAFLVLTRINRQYLSGFTGSTGVVFVSTPSLISPLSRGRKRGGRAELYVDDRYIIRAKRESPLGVFPIDKLSTYLPPLHLPLIKGEKIERGQGRRGKVRVGIEDRISLQEFARLKKDYRGAKWTVTHEVVENLRAVKSGLWAA